MLPLLPDEVIGQIPAEGDAVLVLSVHVRHLAAQIQTPALSELQEAGDIVILMMVISGAGHGLQVNLQCLCDSLSSIDRAQLNGNVNN